jgi:hypothetical protein
VPNPLLVSPALRPPLIDNVVMSKDSNPVTAASEEVGELDQMLQVFHSLVLEGQSV